MPGVLIEIKTCIHEHWINPVRLREQNYHFQKQILFIIFATVLKSCLNRNAYH